MHLTHVQHALQSAIREHGAPNTFSSRWLSEIESAPLTMAQINAVGRRYGTLYTSPLDDLGVCSAQYIGNGIWKVDRVQICAGGE